ncbi:MAG: Coenzyme F420 hydrogenase/dehydrogenase, beta subunit C-terminal domain [Canidatus Methanoxibalbensis ujae]|nr:Coenzyme F420 hydrogenase/dehydrogenase, beta subunit C-terminal domain [Candidatus Methanoxibalbensis ujae]MCW7079205.1 Coenzyme F420 hydrogenase/dehydrogenase, beta subunit C-terminal domain [Candidatus Methanoxibalbensis ujae]MCW7080146.1 Coenzyme F420 hydrogenase/dehydrogenase, beta subunit C-terminal domain [Candidatus Methanospirare jalkutatii]
MHMEDFVRIPAFMEFGFEDLKREVVDRGLCSRCGTCAAFCDKIDISDKPKFRYEHDTVCGLCYTICPRTFISMDHVERKIFERTRRDEEEYVGVFRKCYAVRRSDMFEHNGQDGGAVTAILAYAIDKQIIDCAVVTTCDEKKWRVSVKVAADYDALCASAGTKYSIFPSVIGVKEAIEHGYSSIGFVGLPCQIQGLRIVQTTEQPYDINQDKIKLLIGLFCMENFSEEMLDFIDKICPLENVRKFDIKGREMCIYGKDVHRIPLSEIEHFVGEGCLVCTDFASELADISVGSVGSPDGFSTVIVRTEEGEKLVNGAIRDGYIEAEEIKEEGLREIVKIAKLKRKRGEKMSSR